MTKEKFRALATEEFVEEIYDLLLELSYKIFHDEREHMQLRLPCPKCKVVDMLKRMNPKESD